MVVHILARLLCFLSAMVVVEGHLIIGQSAAWFTMIHERTPLLGLQESLATTFSGKQPCEICNLLQTERDEQKKESSIPEATSLGKLVASGLGGKPVALFPPALSRAARPCSEPGTALWQDDIPHPPPRMG